MKNTLAFILCICAALTAMSQAKADAMFAFTPISISASDTGGAFDVTLTNTGLSSLSIAGFSFEVTVGNSGFTLLSVDETTTASYIFAGNSLFGPDLGFNGTGQTIQAADVTADFGNVIIGAGTTVGLGHVTFSMLPATGMGNYDLTFTGGAASNSLSDADGNLVPSDSTARGTINVMAGTTGVVPEPSTFILMLTAAGALAILRRRARC